MKIKMKTLAAGTHGIMQPGKEYEVTADAGQAFIDGGYAELIAGEEVGPAAKKSAKKKEAKAEEVAEESAKEEEKAEEIVEEEVK